MPSLATDSNDPATQAAPPMSALIISMFEDGLIDIPPLLNQNNHIEEKGQHNQFFVLSKTQIITSNKYFYCKSKPKPISFFLA